MPNWCKNVSVVKHEDPKMIEKFVESFNEKRIGQTFRPEPDYSKVTVFGFSNPNTPVDPKESWYYWRGENWGVKWDIGDDEHPISVDSGTTEVEVCFESPWCPPLKLYEYMTDELGFEIDTDYFEFVNGKYLGRWSSNGGFFDMEFPESFEELENLGPINPSSSEIIRGVIQTELKWLEDNKEWLEEERLKEMEDFPESEFEWEPFKDEETERTLGYRKIYK